MQRRTLLQSIAVLGAGSLSGCTAGSPAVDTEETTSPGPVEPELTDTDFEVIDQGCGNEVNEATVEFDGETVEITGTIAGSDACKTAALADASYDPDADELRITVETVDREDAGACAQCIVEIDYRATVTFVGSLPPSVVVTHDGVGGSREVASTDRVDEGNG